MDFLSCARQRKRERRSAVLVCNTISIRNYLGMSQVCDAETDRTGRPVSGGGRDKEPAHSLFSLFICVSTLTCHMSARQQVNGRNKKKVLRVGHAWIGNFLSGLPVQPLLPGISPVPIAIGQRIVCVCVCVLYFSYDLRSVTGNDEHEISEPLNCIRECDFRTFRVKLKLQLHVHPSTYLHTLQVPRFLGTSGFMPEYIGTT